MKLHTLWKMRGDDSVELLFALDEYTVEQNWQAWESGRDAARKRYGITEADTREVLIEVPHSLIAKAFEPGFKWWVGTLMIRPFEVTEEMVEQAARAWEPGFDSYDEQMRQDALKDARRALTAALQEQEGEHGV